MTKLRFLKKYGVAIFIQFWFAFIAYNLIIKSGNIK